MPPLVVVALMVCNGCQLVHFDIDSLLGSVENFWFGNDVVCI